MDAILQNIFNAILEGQAETAREQVEAALAALPQTTKTNLLIYFLKKYQNGKTT